MYLTMNRFRIKPGSEEQFEQIWKGRESKLPEVPGFVAFHLLKGPERDGYRLYASHTTWNREEDFVNWTRSEAFRQAHAGVGDNQNLYAGKPDLEMFESVQSID